MAGTRISDASPFFVSELGSPKKMEEEEGVNTVSLKKTNY